MADRGGALALWGRPQVVVIGLITGSLFYNQGVTLEDARTIFGACFMACLFMSFGGFPQLPITLDSKRVWFKHRAAGFYPAYGQALAMVGGRGRAGPQSPQKREGRAAHAMAGKWRRCTICATPVCRQCTACKHTYLSRYV